MPQNFRLEKEGLVLPESGETCVVIDPVIDGDFRLDICRSSIPGPETLIQVGAFAAPSSNNHCMATTWEILSNWSPLMTVRRRLDQVVRRISTRGPRPVIGLFLSGTIVIWLFYAMMHRRDGGNSRGIPVAIQPPGVLPSCDNNT